MLPSNPLFILLFSITINLGFIIDPIFSKPITPYRTLRYQGVIGQTTYYTCGPAAVSTLLTYYYLQPTTEAEILKLSEKSIAETGKKPEEGGVTALALRQSLAKKGIQSQGIKLTLKSLADYFRKGGLPVILHVTKPQMHYVLAVGLVDNWLIVADPSWGQRIQSLQSLVDEKGFSGVTLVPIPPENLINTVQKQQTETLVRAQATLVRLNTLKRRSL